MGFYYVYIGVIYWFWVGILFGVLDIVLDKDVGINIFYIENGFFLVVFKVY